MPTPPKQTRLETRVLTEIKKHKTDSGLTLSDISRLSGVEISLLSRIYSGKRVGMSLSTAGRICDYLGLVLGRPVPKTSK